MKYKQAKNLKEEEFKSLCGVSLETFQKMVFVVREKQKQPPKQGRPSKLNIEDQIMMTQKR